MHCLWEIIDNAVDEALGRGRHPDRRSPAPRRLVRGPRPRPRHPRRHRAAHRPHRASRSSSPSCTPAASSAAARTRPPAACTVLEPRWSTRCPPASTSRSTGLARPTHELPSRRAGGVRRRRRPAPGRARAASRPYESRSELRVAGRGQARGHRHPDPVLARPRRSSWPDASLDYEQLADRARQTSFLVPGLHYRVRDERGPRGADASEELVHDGGITDFVEFLAPDPPVTDVWRLQGSGPFTETVPVLDAPGHMSVTETRARVRRRHRAAVGDRLRHHACSSFVNIITTPKGGTHVAGFDAALLKVFRKQLRAERPTAQGRRRQGREGRHRSQG